MNPVIQPHRISVRSVTQNRRTSRDAACTMIIGRDTAHLGPSAVRASHITCSSAVISWLPANSNHQHIVCVNNVELKLVKPGVYRQTIIGMFCVDSSEFHLVSASQSSLSIFLIQDWLQAHNIELLFERNTCVPLDRLHHQDHRLKKHLVLMLISVHWPRDCQIRHR